MLVKLQYGAMTAIKYTLYTLAGALITYLVNQLPNIHGSYAIWTPVFGLILKTLGTIIATKEKEF